jgi:Phage tail assembly chaperone protein
MGQKFAAYNAQGAVVAFYDSVDSPPPEGVTVTEISDDDWQMLLEGQADGKLMAIDADGQPELRDPPPPTDEQVAVSVRADRDARLAETDWLLLRHQDETVVGKATTLTADEATTLVDYRQALRDVPTQAGFPHEIDWPQEPGQPG